jgi:hypothetical protein
MLPGAGGNVHLSVSKDLTTGKKKKTATSIFKQGLHVSEDYQPSDKARHLDLQN